MNETLQVLTGRRSIRRYRPDQIQEEELEEILKAGIYAPSAKNRQTTKLVVVQDAETIAKMSRMNAKAWGRENFDPFFGAPTVVIVFSDSDYLSWIQDGSLVMGNLLNAAASLGIGSCWVNRALETFRDDPEGVALREQWGLTENWKGVGNCVLGYPLEGGVLKDMRRKEGRILRV